MPVEVVVRGSPKWAELRGDFVDAQAGVCAICRESIADEAHLDHCHVTGCIRGALCPSCNTKLGWYENNRREIETYLARAAEYEAYRTPERLSNGERWRKHWQEKVMK